MQELLKLFQKIEVIESTKQAKPGSVGYITSLDELGGYNTLLVQALFTRFGKNGKKRFSISELKVPLIDVSCLSVPKDSKRALETLINRHLMPRDINHNLYDSKIKIITEKSKNLMELDTWDFIAYISAISMFMSHYNFKGGIGIRVDNIGVTIYNMFRSKDQYPKLEEYIKYFDNTTHRKIWLDALRKETSIYRQVITKHLNLISKRYKRNYELLRAAAKDNGIKIERLV
ncbi:unnamed protein product [marine sediment metagenome]|uniref:Uncharacterized protein n=1 Tax=marine sediment metagenome TaxID=412755 RepID=X0VB35_9ZZZZ